MYDVPRQQAEKDFYQTPQRIEIHLIDDELVIILPQSQKN